jgi:hypothetical protein
VTTATAVTATFNVTACAPGTVDLNNDLSDGCEYVCTAISATDEPDASFVDANCDGVDGDVTQTVFVDVVSGNNANAGTRAAPGASVAAGIAKAQTDGKTLVLVSKGTYNERVTLANGISIHGSYDAAAAWARSNASVSKILSGAVAGGRVSALDAINISSPTSVTGMSIEAGNASTMGMSSYGVYCLNCEALVLTRNTIKSGNGGVG